LNLVETIPTAFDRIEFWEFRGASWFGIVVWCLLDRFFAEPIEPVADRFLDGAMTLSQCFDFIALLSTDCSEKPFSRNLSLRLLTQFVGFFQADMVQPTQYFS